ncbi:HIT-type domain-containing protein [Plasmodiophora brassicae]|uniref:HIT-type domain-containing protein n=1 Tax=Plasmodiophora brassicae TaxID=37360 RepID=A0A0G4IV31_PLABS|nr:hypothetical protein PBRA_007128 [Plasmodiophora brassicae]SPQ98569.1 unnamed protein product [Plasmodiophora brassicae]
MVGATTTLACAVCSAGVARYRCPKCQQRTCSVACVKRHKLDALCDGVRSRTGFVAVRDFSDRQLVDDFAFLEEVSVIRGRSDRELRTVSSRRKQPVFLNKLASACKSSPRQIDLRLMPPGMTRRRLNRSIFDTAASKIFWSLGLVFGTADAESITLHRIDEDTPIVDIVDRVINRDAVTRHRLSKLSEGTTRAFLLAPAVGTAPFRRLSPSMTLRQALVQSVVVEYPIIHIIEERDSGTFRLADRNASAPTTNDIST